MTRPSPAGDIDVLFDDDTLRIACRRAPGDTDLAVVAFAGVQGAFGGIPVEEFASSLGRATTPHDAYFVIDKTQGWYNQTSANIDAVLRGQLARRRIVTLGNSMGGFGALLFGDRLGAFATLAICPQYSIVGALVPFETRWRDFATAIPVIRHTTCLPEPRSETVRRLVLAGGGHNADMAHARLIHGCMGARDGIFALPHGHDLAQVLKRHGALSPLLEAVLRPEADHAAVADVLDAAGLDYDFWDAPWKGPGDASGAG